LVSGEALICYAKGEPRFREERDHADAIAWQGWLVLFVWLGAIAAMALALLPRHHGEFVLAVVAMSLLLLLICYAKGEPPAWRWGGKES
jgi:hypothetical protein